MATRTEGKVLDQALKLIRRTTSQSWGADEKAIRTMSEALLASRGLYCCNCINLTKAQWKQIERLNNQTMRGVTGLPRYTPLYELRKYAGMNKIEECRVTTNRALPTPRKNYMVEDYWKS